MQSMAFLEKQGGEELAYEMWSNSYPSCQMLSSPYWFYSEEELMSNLVKNPPGGPLEEAICRLDVCAVSYHEALENPGAEVVFPSRLQAIWWLLQQNAPETHRAKELCRELEQTLDDTEAALTAANFIAYYKSNQASEA